MFFSLSDWMVNLANCFLEEPTEFGAKCQYRVPSQTQTETITVYLQFSTQSSNTLQSFCSYFYQVGNALSANRPSGNWLLEDINYMSHLTGSYYWINVTWRRYQCPYIQVPKEK